MTGTALDTRIMALSRVDACAVLLLLGDRHPDDVAWAIARNAELTGGADRG